MVRSRPCAVEPLYQPAEMLTLLGLHDHGVI
jgi:hypothetical protein